MKKTMRRLFAILMTLAIAITAIPMMEVKAAEEDIQVSITFGDNPTVYITNDNVNTVTMSAKLTISGVEKKISHINTGYGNVDNSECVKWITFWNSNEIDDGIYSVNSGVSRSLDSGEYKIFVVEIYYTDDTRYTMPIDSLPEASFYIDNQSDRTAPVISNVSMNVEDGEGNVVTPNSNGEYYLERGEGYIIEVSADITDPDVHGEVTAGIDTEWLYAYIVPTSEENGMNYYQLLLTKSSDGKYSATVPVDGTLEDDYTDAMTNCEFYLEYIEAYDLVGNQGTYNPNEKGEDYHFFVTKDGETVLPTYKDIELYFYDENGELLTEDAIIVEETTRKTTLKDLLGDNIPKLDDKVISDLGFLGWENMYIEGYITNETEFFVSESGEKFGFDPVFEKKYVEVSLRILDEDGELNWTYEEYLIDGDATYQDLIALLPTPPTVNGCAFVEWDLGGYKLTDVVEDDWVALEAIYDKYPVTIERKYVDTTGAVKNEKVTKLYPAGTTMESIYNEYAVTPSDASTSLSIVEWQVDEGNTEAEISVDNNVLVLTALYDEKTIVEVCYDYIAPMDDHGVEKMVYSYEIIAKDIASDVDALIDYCKNTVEGKFTFEHYSGYEFLGWDYENPSYAHKNDDSIIDSINIMAKINIEEVITVVAALGMDMVGEPEAVYYYVVEAGDTFTLPEQYDGYYLKWYDMMQQYEEVKDGKYIIPSDAVAGDYYLFMSEKTDKVPAQDNPPADNQQGGTTQPGNTNNNVPPTADTTTAIPYITLLLLGAGVFMVGSKRRNFVR